MNSLVARSILETWASWYLPKPVPWLRYTAGRNQAPEIQAEWVDLLASHTQGAHKQVTRMLEDMADKPPNLLQMRRMLRDAETKVIPADSHLDPELGPCPTCTGCGWLHGTMMTELGEYTCCSPCQMCTGTGRVPLARALRDQPISLAEWQRRQTQPNKLEEDF